VLFASLYRRKKPIKTQQGMKKCDWFRHDVILYIETVASLDGWLHQCHRKGGEALYMLLGSRACKAEYRAMYSYMVCVSAASEFLSSEVGS